MTVRYYFEARSDYDEDQKWTRNTINNDNEGFITLQDLIASHPYFDPSFDYRIAKEITDELVEVTCDEKPVKWINFIKALRALIGDFENNPLIKFKRFIDGDDVLTVTKLQAVVIETLADFGDGKVTSKPVVSSVEYFE